MDTRNETGLRGSPLGNVLGLAACAAAIREAAARESLEDGRTAVEALIDHVLTLEEEGMPMLAWADVEASGGDVDSLPEAFVEWVFALAVGVTHEAIEQNEDAAAFEQPALGRGQA